MDDVVEGLLPAVALEAAGRERRPLPAAPSQDLDGVASVRGPLRILVGAGNAARPGLPRASEPAESMLSCSQPAG